MIYEDQFCKESDQGHGRVRRVSEPLRRLNVTIHVSTPNDRRYGTMKANMTYEEMLKNLEKHRKFLNWMHS